MNWIHNLIVCADISVNSPSYRCAIIASKSHVSQDSPSGTLGYMFGKGVYFADVCVPSLLFLPGKLTIPKMIA